ncbi:hypothetical protein K0M31_007143 [Melipona bicolor]|uniref:Uncharacterized protein n=1 Tax=Melipona bicolor TaxID=60889 RepID=A0AA40KKW6_9HYME|nr:hypothetical protein K0M31_007143 [Melipona bicolor]
METGQDSSQKWRGELHGNWVLNFHLKTCCNQERRFYVPVPSVSLTRHGPQGRGTGIRPVSTLPQGNYQLAPERSSSANLGVAGDHRKGHVCRCYRQRAWKNLCSPLKDHRENRLSHTGSDPLSPFTRNFPKVLHE